MLFVLFVHRKLSEFYFQESQRQCSDHQDLWAGGGEGRSGEAAQERHQGHPQRGAGGRGGQGPRDHYCEQELRGQAEGKLLRRRHNQRQPQSDQSTEHGEKIGGYGKVSILSDVLFKKIKGLFRLEEVKARIVKILVDRESVAKENNELKRYFCLIEEKYFGKIEENIFPGTSNVWSG